MELDKEVYIYPLNKFYVKRTKIKSVKALVSCKKIFTAEYLCFCENQERVFFFQVLDFLLIK